MSIISIKNLSFSYDNSYHNIFNNISFNIDTQWRLGLIGRNGRGKTTLLRILNGEFEYQGNILSSTQFFYFPYSINNKNEITIDIIRQQSNKDDWEIMRELNLLKCDCEILYRPFNTLSMGEQTKCMLCALFLTDNAFLLLDEPTNHLDYDSCLIIAEYLKKKSGFILVSHNRFLLNETCDHIISINRNSVDIVSGNYDIWKNSFDNKNQFEIKRNEKLKKDIKHLEDAAKRTALWSDKTEMSKFGDGHIDRGFVGHKAAKMMCRSKAYEKRVNQKISEKENLLSDTENALSLKLNAVPYRSNTFGYVKNVGLSFDGNTIFNNISFEINRGDRIAIVGKNGSGKSSLIKILLKQIKNSDGEFKINSDVKISYVSQSVEEVSGSLKDYAKINEIDYNVFLSVLNYLDFEKELYSNPIENYSLGQKKKVQLAKSLCDKAHLYIWDEPLNYIDIISRSQLENMIAAYSPTMIFVEHDKTFTSRIATKIISL